MAVVCNCTDTNVNSSLVYVLIRCVFCVFCKDLVCILCFFVLASSLFVLVLLAFTVFRLVSSVPRDCWEERIQTKMMK